MGSLASTNLSNIVILASAFVQNYIGGFPSFVITLLSS